MSTKDILRGKIAQINAPVLTERKLKHTLSLPNGEVVDPDTPVGRMKIKQAREQEVKENSQILSERQEQDAKLPDYRDVKGVNTVSSIRSTAGKGTFISGSGHEGGLHRNYENDLDDWSPNR